MVFRYPDTAHVRRHGPRGYSEYELYKAWLRDEFAFRCVYCLCRESWLPEGDATFGVDHLRPQSLSPELRTEYDNLVYACCGCNSHKQAQTFDWDPSEEGLAEHLEVLQDGTIRGLTAKGLELIQVCRLGRPKLTEFRRWILDLLGLLRQQTGPEAVALLNKHLGFPANLPNLAALRPPGGNARPEGIATSYCELRQRGELPETY